MFGFSMLRSQWQRLTQFARPQLPRAKRVKSRRQPPTWFAGLLRRRFKLWTKSEVRAHVKRILEVDRLPVGYGLTIQKLAK